MYTRMFGWLATIDFQDDYAEFDLLWLVETPSRSNGT